MAFLGSETLRQRIPSQKIIEPYDPDAIKHAAYELRLGADFFLTSRETGVKQTLGEGESVVLPPGQFAILVTRECVSLPSTVLGLISIKSSLKVRGLVNVSGFHVDPGFIGQLHFSVYNAGSQKIVLTHGDRLFLLWLCALDAPTGDVYNGRHNHQKGLTSEEVMMIQGDVASPSSLKKQLDDLRVLTEKQFQDLKVEGEKRFHTLDHTITVWRGVMITIGVALALLLIKPLLESFSAPKPTAATMSAPTSQLRP